MRAEEQIKNEIANCLPVLKSGGTILYPTDTIWGIGCDATNENAVRKIFEIKKREESKGMIILVDAAEKLNRYVKKVPDVAWDLIEYTEKPLTIVYSGAVNIAKNLVGSDGTIAVRVVKNDFCIDLLRKFGRPVVSTSANISGTETAFTFDKISEEILRQVDYVVNLPEEKNKTGKPSSIIQIEINGVIKILRK